VALLLRCLKQILPATSLNSHDPAADAVGHVPSSAEHQAPRALAEGLAALRHLLPRAVGEGEAEEREVAAGTAAARSICELLSDSDDLLFLCLMEALHLHKALSILTCVSPKTMQGPCVEGSRGDAGSANGERAAHVEARPALPGKRKRTEAGGAAVGAEGDLPCSAEAPSSRYALGHCRWFCEELSPARLLDAVCRLCGGDSGMLLDLMLSPDNQVRIWLMAWQRQGYLAARRKPDMLSAAAFC
jgi:hypothetical protein